MSSLEERKQELRRDFYCRWRSFSEDTAQKKTAERQLRQNLWQALGKTLSDPRKKILSYRPFPSEPAIDRLLGRSRCQLYYPRVLGNALVATSEDNRRCLELFRMDLILVPCMLFRSDGIRLGRGGGYFDRALRFLPRSKTLLIARHWQLEETIPAEEHDIPVKRWLTDRQIHPPLYC